MEIFDISQPVDGANGHFPGDTSFQSDWMVRQADGNSVNVSRITTSPHVGSHADAPLHFDAAGIPIDQVSLLPYLGPCELIRVSERGPIGANDLKGVDARATPRILFCGHPENRVDFPADFPLLDQSALNWIRKNQILLVGMDAPSMDRPASKELPIHHELGNAGVAILENLALSHVEPGRYELIALPLRWVGLDAAPVRAILRRS